MTAPDFARLDQSPAFPEPSIIRVSLIKDRELHRGSLELIAAWDRDAADRMWIDITSANKTDVEPLLEEWFGFHELAAEDALSPNTLPKYDSFKNYDFFVFRSVSIDVVRHEIATWKLACFLGSNFLITVHNEAMPAIDSVWQRLPQDRRILNRGGDFALYSVLDLLVDAHFPLIEEIEERMDDIHNLVFASPTQTLLDELLDLKRDLNHLRRHSLPQRELLNQVSRGDAKFVAQEHLIYFRDLYDHMFRIGESIDVERDLATSTMEAYLSVVANRTNEIMKVLTIFSSILLPVNLVAGIYGMNFDRMPELRWNLGYWWALGLMGSIVFLMLVWFWRLGWLGARRRDVIRHERRVRKVLRKGASRAVPSDSR
ncbi:MAG: magnesium/cobalt transporter CorA [Thermoanaerobaculia bacterium]|jgi:magnesium transporter